MLQIVKRAILPLAFSIIATSSIYSATAFAEESSDEIYVEVEDGVPTFSDRSTLESKKVDVQPPMIFESEKFVPDTLTREEAPSKPKPVKYTLEITDPPDDSAIRENSGALNLTVRISPNPGIDHRAELLMDGQVIRTLQGSGEVALANVDRGTHQFQVRVVDGAGKTVASGPVTRVSMLRFFKRPGT